MHDIGKSEIAWMTEKNQEVVVLVLDIIPHLATAMEIQTKTTTEHIIEITVNRIIERNHPTIANS